MRRIQSVVLVVAVLLLAVGIGASVVTAQQDTTPIAFTGSVVDADGNPAPVDTTIVATVENGTTDETVVETAGEYGGGFNALTPGAAENTATVRFYVDGPDGPAAAENPVTVDVDQGQYTQDLTFPSGTFESDDSGGGGGGGGGGQVAPSGGGGGQVADDTDETAVDENSTDTDGTDDTTAESTDDGDDTTAESTGDNTTADDTNDETPGFGLVTALVALTSLLVVARRR